MKLTKAQMREYIIIAHGMASSNYVQSDTVMRNRIAKFLDAAITNDEIMSGLLGRENGNSSQDILTGTVNLDDKF